eukprot:m.339321 g.339321  ORF g.339321 m.339321 type:complete len:367 (-) comp18751_c0_seq1:70-1170(-)
MVLLKHTDFTPVGSVNYGRKTIGNPESGERHVEKERVPLEDVINMATALKCGKKENVKLLRSTNVPENNDKKLGGLLYGVFESWRDEKSFALHPQALWYTIVMETVKTIKSHPEKFRSIFTSNTTGKENVVLVTLAPDIVDPQSFVALLQSKLASPELVDIVSNNDGFETPLQGPVSFNEVMATSLLEMASPFFDYWSDRCGHRGIDIQGTEADWKLLKSKVETLNNLVGKINYGYSEGGLERGYYKKVIKRIEDITQRLKSPEGNHDEFISDCFLVGQNCGSGHIYNARGWIFDFFGSRVLVESGSPITYVSWGDIPTGRMFYQSYGLCKGSYDERDVLNMEFSSWTFEVFDKKLFQKISCKKEE